nr:hypothetical protein [Tanacetum cinerariifolium]
MFDKDLYDCWKGRIELYMQNREQERMILESVEQGLLIWPTIEENGVTRTNNYAELSPAEKIQAGFDLKETNIIIQGLPSNIYSLVNHHIVAKNLWERIQLLMQKQFQVNTKFLNSLPPEWSKFVTDVKLVKDLHTTNFDQLHAYLQQHKLYANESSQYRLIHPTHHYSTTYSSTPLAITYPSVSYPNAYSTTIHQAAFPQQQYVPQIEYNVSIINQQTHLTEFPLIDSDLAVPVFKQGDDPIDCINKMMSFLSTVVSSCFSTTNNQLRNSYILRQQATIHDGREEELQANKGIAEGSVVQTVITNNVAYQAGDLDAYDSYCNDITTAKVTFMANLSPYELDVLSEIMELSLSIKLYIVIMRVSISHETSFARIPQQNGVVKRRNRTLFEAAQTMLIYAKALLFLWGEEVATAKLDLSYLHVFGALCYPTNDSENMGKLQAKADIGIFIGYAPMKKAYCIYNRCTRKIIETIHVNFDELTGMAYEQSSLGPALHEMTTATPSLVLVPNPTSRALFVPPSKKEWDLVLQPVLDEFYSPLASFASPNPVIEAPVFVGLTGLPFLNIS